MKKSPLGGTYTTLAEDSVDVFRLWTDGAAPCVMVGMPVVDSVALAPVTSGWTVVAGVDSEATTGVVEGSSGTVADGMWASREVAVSLLAEDSWMGWVSLTGLSSRARLRITVAENQ